ncbi:hypothetical protein CGJ29_18790 [Vibrio parahaemolyticus]|nr:hypothetical protein CGJ29_18790 [Vibrio parahaemolyticus]
MLHTKQSLKANLKSGFYINQRACLSCLRKRQKLSKWFLVLGSWFLVLGSWFLVLGSRFSVGAIGNGERRK